MRRTDRMPIRLARTVLNRAASRSDYRKWQNPANLDAEWDERTKLLALFVPNGARVLEFGAGKRQLERYLPPGCKYFPSDLVERGSDTIVLDLNHRDRPDLRHLNAEIAVFSGTLEYVHDMPRLVTWLSEQISSRCICSYAAARSRRRTLARLLESLLRARDGWVNAYSDDEFIRLFSRSGFRCVQRDQWKGQGVFVFDKERISSALSD